MNIGDLGATLVPAYDKSVLEKMIAKLGKDEVANRFAWLHNESSEIVSELIDKFLTDDYVDDKGTPAGTFFY